MSILNWIEKIKRENEGPRITAQEPRNMAQGGRIELAGGGALWKLLYKGKPGLQVGKVQKDLVNKYRNEGMSLIDAITKGNKEGFEIVNQKKLKIVKDKMSEVNIQSDEYVDLIDEHIRIVEPEFYDDIKRWESTRPDLADKTRALVHPDWAEARLGENFQDVLENRQARALKEQSDEIDRMYPDTDGGIQDIQQQTVTEIDEMNKANLDELLEGRKKNAHGGRIGYDDGQLVAPSVDGSRPGYRGDKTQEVLKAYKDYKKSYYSGRQRYPIITFRQFYPMYAKENFAEGGSAGQLVQNTADGSRPGYQGPGAPAGSVRDEAAMKYFKDKDFLKWAKEKYPKWKPGKAAPPTTLNNILITYERQLVKKNKIVGIEQLAKALGDDNPYSVHTLRNSLTSRKMHKNISAAEKTMIKKGKILREIIEGVGGKSTNIKELYGPFKYLKDVIKRTGGVGGTPTQIWELNPKQIKKINALLNQEYGKSGLQDNTIKNIYNLFDDKKFMKEIRNYDGGVIDPKSYMFKKVYKPGQGTGMAYAYMQLGRAFRGEIELDGIKLDKKLGNKIIRSTAHSSATGTAGGAMGSAANRWAKFQMAKHFNNPNASYETLTKTIVNAFKEVGMPTDSKGRLKMNIDEIFPARTGQLTYAKGSGVYNQFVQFIDSKINQQVKRNFDSGMTKRLHALTDKYKLAQKTGDYSKVEKILEKHGEKIDEFYENNPKAKGKVNLTQFQWDAKNKKFLNPKQVFESQYKGSYKTIPSKIRTGMEKFYGKTGISIDPGTARTLEKSSADVKALTQGKAWNKAIKSSKAKMLAKTLELAGIDICSSQLAAAGGRIGFAKKVCGMKFAEQNEDAFMKKAGQNKLAAGMFKSGEIRPFLMKAKNWAKSNMGPTGWIGGELLIVGLGTAWDMSQGKGWKEAMDNWTGLGGHFGQAEKRLKQIGIEQGYSEAEINEAMKIGQLMDLSTEVEGKQWELEQVQEAEDIGGTARYKSDPKRRFVRPKEYVRGEYQDPKRIRDLKTETPKLWEKGTELYESLKDYDFSVGAYDEMQQKKKREEYDRMMELRSKSMMPSYGQQFQVSGSPEFKPVTYAGGGMVGIRRPNAIPPDSGPMSQGLRSLYINDKDY